MLLTRFRVFFYFTLIFCFCCFPLYLSPFFVDSATFPCFQGFWLIFNFLEGILFITYLLLNRFRNGFILKQHCTKHSLYLFRNYQGGHML